MSNLHEVLTILFASLLALFIFLITPGEYESAPAVCTYDYLRRSVVVVLIAAAKGQATTWWTEITNWIQSQIGF